MAASTGSWSGSPSSYGYQWQDCASSCADISGATGSSYGLQASDVGDTVDVVVTATNAGGSSAATSGKTAAVTASGGGGSGSGSGLHVSAADLSCPGSTASTCSELMDAGGTAVHVHGVNLSGTEYACIQGWGIWSNPAQAAAADAQSMLLWHINMVRVLLNEDCWLGLTTTGQYTTDSAYYGSNYRTAIVNFVDLLHSYGIYTEIVDMWNAPGTAEATYQDAEPDEDNSPAMWASMAQTFKNDPDTILSPGGTTTSFSCLMNGGCTADFSPGAANPGPYDGLPSCGTNCWYTVAGLSQGVSIMRSNGFKGPISLECSHFGDTCDAGSGSSWLADKPTDSINPSQLIAEVHNYNGDSCDTASCWDSQYLPIIQGGYPLTTASSARR